MKIDSKSASAKNQKQQKSTPFFSSEIKNQKDILENSFIPPQDSVFITRLRDMTVVNVNNTFLLKTGLNREEIVNQSLSGLPFWKDKNDPKKFKKALSQYNTFNYFETSIQLKAGYTVPVIIFGGLIQFNGEDCIFAVLRDISQVKQAEKFLLESESKYRTLFEQAYNAIFLENDAAEILDANQSASDLFGYSQAELLSMKMSDLLIRREDNLNVYTSSFDESPFEVLATHKNGKTFWIEMTVAPLGIEGKTQYLSIIRNITERRVLEEQLEQAAKMEAVGRLTGSIAHDFNNVLTIIQGFSELALATIDSNEPVSNYLLEINKAAFKAESLIRQLLTFSRKQTRKSKIIDLNELINDMRDMFDRVIGEHIDLRLKLPKRAFKIKADAGNLEQVILNLVVNARDAMADKGILKIKTSRSYLRGNSLKKYNIEKAGAYVFLEVSDTGIGIDGNLLEHIFEPFFTTKDADKGTGLGLSTVYRIIKKLGGQVNVESEPGQGTTFRILLPESKSKKIKRMKTDRSEENLKGSETILVVEDQDELRSVICQTLETHGYQVMEAESGKKALSICKKNGSKINLLLTDIIMPNMNGCELAESIKHNFPQMKNLFMSGYNEEIIGKYGSIISENNYIQKPFTPPALLKKIREVFK